MTNIDPKTVAGFGDEWTRFDQSDLSRDERQDIFDSYFAVFPWQSLPAGAVGMDVGCGSGRWASLVAPKVGHLHCIDASADALAVTRRNLAFAPNASFHHASVDAIPIPDGSLDFGYSLGVLHHVPNTPDAVSACVAKLKKGAPFLLYLYYAFDNRPRWFRAVWKLSDAGRQVVSRLPHGARYVASQAIAAGVYYPLARSAKALERTGLDVSHLPLSGYRDRSFYTMRTDALDRFGTRLEQRFTRAEITAMMERAGLENIRFHDGMPFWCAVGTKR